MQPGILLRRYQRFLADVQLSDGSVITAHCPNTGAMTGCAEPGSHVWLSLSDNPKRKYRHTWELVRTTAGLACIHSARANDLAAEAVARGAIAELAGYTQMQREVRFGREGSRVDLLLRSDARPDCLVEVKCVTLCGEDGLGLFPDAVSQRGSRHLRELAAARAEGRRAVLLFCVLHGGIESVAPAAAIDPVYAATFRAALAAGVEAIAYKADIDTAGMTLRRPLPVIGEQAPERFSPEPA